MRCNMLPVVIVDSVVTESVAIFIDIKNIEHVWKSDRPFLYLNWINVYLKLRNILLPELFAQGILFSSRHDWKVRVGSPWMMSHTRLVKSSACNLHTCSSFRKVKKLQSSWIWHAVWQCVILSIYSKFSIRSLSKRQ